MVFVALVCVKVVEGVGVDVDRGDGGLYCTAQQVALSAVLDMPVV